MARKIMIFLFLCFLFISGVYASEVKLKVLVVNPSETEKKSFKVKYPLPKGIEPQHIIDKGDMEVAYDFENENYFVYQAIELNPAERRIIEIKLKDVWVIEDAQIDFLKEHTEGLVDKLRSTKHFEIGSTLAESIKKRLDTIDKSQNAVGSNIKDKINRYYDNLGVLEEVRSDIGMLENLVVDAGGIVEDRVEVPQAMMAFLDDDAVSQDRTVELRVRAKNPDKEKKGITINVKYYLPEEITPRYVVERGGLEVLYDFDKERFYLFKEKVELAKNETKEYIVRLKDIWRISEVEISALEAHTNNLLLLVKDTQYYEEALSFADKIKEELGEISRTQNLDVPTGEHIAYYRQNEEILDGVKHYVAQLEKIVSRLGSSPGVTIVKAERREGGGIQVQRDRGYEGILLIAESIFKGKAPTPATTWKIIYTILIFLGVLSGVFFYFQHVGRRQRMIDFLTGTFTREYFLQRFREELRIAGKTKKKCALMMMDIDKFKEVNDNYGHGIGDLVLKEYIVALHGAIRTTDLIGRYGGDEFLIALPTMDKELSVKVAENIRKKVESRSIKVGDDILRITTSISIVVFPEDSITVEDLIEKADSSLYKAKSRGGNSVEPYTR